MIQAMIDVALLAMNVSLGYHYFKMANRVEDMEAELTYLNGTVPSPEYTDEINRAVIHHALQSAGGERYF